MTLLAYSKISKILQVVQLLIENDIDVDHINYWRRKAVDYLEMHKDDIYKSSFAYWATQRLWNLIDG